MLSGLGGREIAVSSMTAATGRLLARTLILASLFVRLLLAAGLGFAVDEAYTLAVSRHFQLSWFDHPPMAFWLAWGGQSLFGPDALHLLLRLPFVLLFCASSALLYRLTERLYGPLAGVWALISFTLTPFFFLSAGGWIVPDGPLIFFLLLAANLLIRVLFETVSPREAWVLWLGAGLAIGLAGLSKYLAVFFPLGLGLFLLFSRHHRVWLRHFAPWCAALLAFLTLLPVWIWNAGHDWASFVFQSGRAAPGGRWRPDHLFTVLGGQAAYLLPWTFGGLIIAVSRTVRRSKRESADALLLWLSLPPITVMTLLPLFGAAGLPHWEMPGWLFVFPLLGRWISELELGGKRVHKVTLVLSLATMGLLILFVTSQAQLGWLQRVLPQGQKQMDPTWELVEWRGLREALQQRGFGQPDRLLISTRWMEGGRIQRELPGYPVTVWDEDPRGFAFSTGSSAFLGRDALIITRNLSEADILARYRQFFDSIEKLTPVTISRNGDPEFEVSLYLAKTMRKEFPLPFQAR